MTTRAELHEMAFWADVPIDNEPVIYLKDAVRVYDELKADIERLKEFEWMYEELCK